MKKPAIVSDIMTTKVVTIFEEENLVGIDKGMSMFKFRHLPVIDGDKLIGLVTHRDLLAAAASSLEPGGVQKTTHLNENSFVRDIMQRDVVTVRPDTPLADAGRLMWDQKLGCLPVVGEGNKLLGIVTEADFLRLALALLAG